MRCCFDPGVTRSEKRGNRGRRVEAGVRRGVVVWDVGFVSAARIEASVRQVLGRRQTGCCLLERGDCERCAD